MYLLLDCTDPTFAPLFNIIGLVIKVIWWGIPIALIILATLDLGRAVIENGKDEDVAKHRKRALRRLLYAVLVFAVVWIVKTVLHLVGTLGFTSDVDVNSWETCWQQIF